MSFSLHAVIHDDWPILYSLLADRPAHINISHTKMPSKDEHIAFVKSDPYAAWYLIKYDNKPVGSIYLSRKDEIGVFVRPDFQHLDLQKQAVVELISLHHRKKYYANVAPYNHEGLELFEGLGFEIIQLTLGLKYD